MKTLLAILIIIASFGCSNQKSVEPPCVTLEGKVTGVNLSMFNLGDTLVLDENSCGALRAKRPGEILNKVYVMGTISKVKKYNTREGIEITGLNTSEFISGHITVLDSENFKTKHAKV